MSDKLDVLLSQALAPTQRPRESCNQTLMGKANAEAAKKKVKMLWTGRKAAAAVAAFVLAWSLSVMGFAAWKYLRPAQVAESIGDHKLADAFGDRQASVVGENRQVCGDYVITLLGMVSGTELSNVTHAWENVELKDRCYAIVAMERADGSPMPETSAREYSDLSFFASAYAKGYDPVKVNAATLDGNYADIVEDGILYRLVECDDVSALSEGVIYVGVISKDFYDPGAYCYDGETGSLSRNEEYPGVNALFEVMPAKETDDERTAKEILERLAQKGIDLAETRDAGDKSINEEKVNTGEMQNALKMNGMGGEIAEYALAFVGNPYAWGETSLTNGADSSGFVQSVYANFQIDLPRSTDKQRKEGTKVESLSEAKPGDLIFYDGPAHVAIYLGEGKVVHAMPQDGICVSDADFDEIAGIRRIVE